MKKDNLKKLVSNLPKHPNVLGRHRFFNSAVLIPIVKIKGEYHLLFQKRAAHIDKVEIFVFLVVVLKRELIKTLKIQL